jgi:hypothetical protein
MKDDGRIERLISLAERIITALEGDIAALKEGRTGALSTNNPEIQKLTAIYGREAKGFDLKLAQNAPPTLRQRFFTITAKFREVLQLHARMVTRVKNASEGIIRAIAAEVERSKAPMRPYGPRPGHKPPSSGPMLFNRVV